MFVGQGQRHRLFRIFGFPVFAETSALFLVLFFVLIASSQGAQGTIRGFIFAGVAFASILVHELGHAFAIRRLGYGDSEILLHGFGGMCRWRGQATRQHRILIAIAGPGAGLMIGGIALALYFTFGMPTEFALKSLVVAVLFINIGWSIFNLMPIWPLDGGHVVRYWLLGKRSRTQTLTLSLQISMVVAGALGLTALFFREIFVTVLLAFILYSNYRELQQLKGPPPSIYGY